MRELIIRWCQLEPDRVTEVVDDGYTAHTIKRSGSHLHLVGDDYPLDSLDRAVLLSTVIEAIEARGYSPWHLSKDEDGFAADVTRYPSGYAVTVYGPDKCPTAVEALLTAYLAAIEAES